MATISQGNQPSFFDNALGVIGNTAAGAFTGGVSNLFRAGSDLASNFFNPQARAEGLPPTTQQVQSVQQAQGIPTANQSYNQAASQGAVAGPVNPSSGLSQPTSTPSYSGPVTGDAQARMAGFSDKAAYDLAQSLAAEAANRENKLRGEIGSGWDSYLNGLNDILNNGLPSQRQSQEDIANSQYNQGVNTLGLQKTQGLQDLGNQRTQATQNQAKNLRDISSSIRNAFQAGNVYLGARGAGDSSAADQYSYALTKEGTRQRSDVMQNTANILDQINQRETSLNNIFNTESKNLEETRNQQLAQVAQWFSNAQNQIKQSIAQGGLAKSQDLANLSKDLLNQGINAMNAINQNSQARYNALTEWATNHANDISQLKSNLSQISNYAPTLPGFSGINGTPQVQSDGSFFVPTGFGSSNEKRDIFGNIVNR